MYQNLLQIMSAVRLMARPGGVGMGELADHLGISTRSVYRLLEKLDELNYPYYDGNEGGKERRYQIDAEQAHLRWWLPVPDSSLTLEEKALLGFLLNSVQDQPGLEGLVHSLQQKIAL